MRITLSLIILLFLSCTSTKVLNERFDYEISQYHLENVDTLVDIGCGSAYNDQYISRKYPNLHFILEDLPTDLAGHDLRKALTKVVKDVPYAPNFGTNSRIVTGSSDTIPLPSGRYERVLCRITLHEFTNPVKMVSELKRILSPTGRLIVVERLPSYPGERDKHCKQLYLTKENILKQMGSLKLLDSVPLQQHSKQGLLLTFTK
ncbi:MAG: Methyltransferase type 11 [Ferruginibacter sp.]|nr:Methyltransferase type 11 [Ferruginibacter sp.]